jgi:hypothetical protein
MRPFERNRGLTASEHIRRIGELLAIAVIRYRYLHTIRTEWKLADSPPPALSLTKSENGYYASFRSSGLPSLRILRWRLGYPIQRLP